MRLLIIEQNQNLSQVIHSVASGEGHEVMLATSGEQALRVFRQRPADVVLGALELGDEDGLAILRRLRAAPQGGEPQVILTSAYRRRYDPAVQAAMAELSAREFLSQPFSVLDFMDSLRRLAEAQASQRTSTPPGGATPLGGAPAARRPEARNLVRLARLWRSRATGVVRVEGAAGLSKGWITLKGGGPVHGGDWALLEALLYADDLIFDRAAVDGQGDWLGLGRLLFEAARDPGQQQYAEGHLYEALVSTAPSEMINLLPLTAASKQMVEQSDGTLTLGELIARAGVEARSVGEELYALQQLRLIALQPPLARAHHSGENSGERRRMPQEGRRERLARAPRSVAASTQTAAFEESALPSEVSRTVTRTRPSGERSVLRSMSRSAVARSRSRGIPDPDRVTQRLIRELERLQGARPAVILGVPPDGDRELMLASTNRMRRRYALLMEESQLPAEGREAAASLKQLVESAYRRLRRGQNQPLSPTVEPPSVVDVGSLLREGQRLLRLGEWDMADQLLSRAHQQDAFQSSILAHLGWARFNNASRGSGRVGEGRDFVLLALEFDPTDADALFFLASIRLQTGEVEGARDALRRAVVLYPTDSRFPRLAQGLPPEPSSPR